MGGRDVLHTPGTASQTFKVSLQLVRMRCREGVIEHERDASGHYLIRESAMIKFMNERAAKKRRKAQARS